MYDDLLVLMSTLLLGKVVGFCGSGLSGSGACARLRCSTSARRLARDVRQWVVVSYSSAGWFASVCWLLQVRLRLSYGVLVHLQGVDVV